MNRSRVNPFDQGTPERILFDRYRKAVTAAAAAERQAAIHMTEARAESARAARYAEALHALGHGDRVPGQKALPDYAKLAQ